MILFKITPIEVSNKTILRLEVKPGTATPYYYVSDGNKIAFMKILKEYEEKELPEFYSEQQFFIVTLKNKNYFNGGTTPNTTPNITEKEELIIKLIKDNPQITVKDIAEMAGNITIDGVKYNLKRLKEKGIIKRIGSNRKGYWEVVDFDGLQRAFRKI